MTVALNLYLSTLFAGAGLIVAVCVLVYLCAKLCEWVAHEWQLRRVWRDEPFTRAIVSVAYWCEECQAEYGRGHKKMAHATAGPFRWRQRRWWSWLVGRMYVLGIIGGSVHSGHEDGWIVHRLSWRGSRPYILGRQKFMWGRWPLLHRLRFGHWPESVWMGLCGVCAPWPCCGATGFDHEDGCDGE